MPRYAIDEVNAVSRAKRRSQRQQDDDSILEELKNQSAMRGVTCNKMKIRKRLTTDGLFTMHCLGCGLVLHYTVINKAGRLSQLMTCWCITPTHSPNGMHSKNT